MKLCTGYIITSAEINIKSIALSYKYTATSRACKVLVGFCSKLIKISTDIRKSVTDQCRASSESKFYRELRSEEESRTELSEWRCAADILQQHSILKHVSLLTTLLPQHNIPSPLNHY